MLFRLINSQLDLSRLKFLRLTYTDKMNVYLNHMGSTAENHISDEEGSEKLILGYIDDNFPPSAKPLY